MLAGTTHDAAADAEVETGLRRLVPKLDPPPANRTTPLVDAGRTSIVLASDADDEVRMAIRAVVDAVRAGTPLGRIALLYASDDPYARLVHEQLAAAQIAVNGPAVVPLAGRVAGRVLLDLLRLPERGFRRQDVFAWLAGAPILVDGRWAPTVRWERLSRDAGVVAGREDWDKRLAALADDSETRAAEAEADPEQPPWRAERRRETAERARRLRTFVLGLVDDLDAAAREPRAWGEHAALGAEAPRHAARRAAPS